MGWRSAWFGLYGEVETTSSIPIRRSKDVLDHRDGRGKAADGVNFFRTRKYAAGGCWTEWELHVAVSFASDSGRCVLEVRG